MSDYTKSTNFAAKDALTSGNAAKIVKGTEIDTEFNNIAIAIATKADIGAGGGGGGTGDVVGPAAATDNAIARFNLTTGKLIQNSVGVLGDDGSLSGVTLAASAITSGTFSDARLSSNVAFLNASQRFTNPIGFYGTNPSAVWPIYAQNNGTNPASVFYADQANAIGTFVIANSISATLIYFGYGTATSNTVVGSITTTGSSTAYNTSSDYRLKTNIVPLTNAIDRVKNLIAHRFNWVSNPSGTAVDGFLAHEVTPVVPEAIVGAKDAVNADGSIKAQAIDQSKLVPLLVAALQEAIARIEALEAA